MNKEDLKTTTPTLDPPRHWGSTDEELATDPIHFRDGLLDGQVHIVSGGGSGIGRAITYMLARLGANVVICGRRPEKLAETARGVLERVGKEVVTHPMSIREPERVEELMAQVWNRFGRLDGVINNGGGQFPQPSIDYSVKGWNAVVDTNLNGSWFMMQKAAQLWRDHKTPGKIVNIVAVVTRGMPQVAHTCAARAAVIDLSKALADEWAPLGISINCIAPGSIESEGLNVYPRSAALGFANANPMRRFGEMFDIAHAVVYVLDASTGGHLSGKVLTVDGGRQQWGEDWPAGIPEYFKVPGR